ncbi:MAG: DUF3341 domain-containing protein [Salibacteraceae bacterium]
MQIKEVYTPFPVHGLDKVLGVKWTRLAICSFMFGITGLTLAVIGIWYFMVSDWPMNIGGKPSFSYYENVTSFIPVTFEFTVLCAAHGMAITYFFRNWTFPGVSARNPHPKTTDDHFAVELEPWNNATFSKEDLESALKDTGAVEIFEK